jgi:flagellin
MGLRIGTNVQSLVGQRALNTQREAGNHEMEKLSTGSRIVTAADDAAGLAISEKFKAEIRSNRQASRNTQDAISLVQVAEGGLNEVSSMLIRMRELSIQSASDTLSDTERQFTDKETQALKGEISRIAQNTKFNGNELLSGVGEKLQFQVGTHGDPEKDRIMFDVAAANATTEALGVSEVTTATRESSQTNLEALDKAISTVSGTRAGFGAMQNRLQSTVNNLDVYHENISAANSRIRDADVAMESAELTKKSILTQAATSTLAQANQSPGLALKLIG